jgi:hypothetical protein
MNPLPAGKEGEQIFTHLTRPIKPGDLILAGLFRGPILVLQVGWLGRDFRQTDHTQPAGTFEIEGFFLQGQVKQRRIFHGFDRYVLLGEL